MPSPTAYDLIKGRLATVFAGIATVVDADEADGALPQQLDPFLTIEGAFSTERPYAVSPPSSKCLLDSGALVVMCYARGQPDGAQVARRLSEQVIEQLRVQLLDDVMIQYLARQPGIIRDGLWTAVAVTVQYQRHFTAAVA